MTITLSVLDEPRTDVWPAASRGRPGPPDGAMFAFDDHGAVGPDLVEPLGRILVHAARIHAGQRVLDVAGGTGIAAIPAALRGAEVVATDMTRERLQVGRVEAVRRGAVVDWVVGNPEALPYASQSFDSVVSCLGVMLTPHHQTAANELLRVSMLGGRIGLLSWTPEGLMGRLAALVNRILPPPQTAALAPTLWGDEAYVLTLLGDRVTSVGASRQRHEVNRFANPREFRNFVRQSYGPTRVGYRTIAERPERVAELDHAVVDLARDHMTRRGLMQWEYLLLTAHRAG
jgi:ubiquinone/menaquinone biosynthesis C-methylase UbiE